MSNNTLFHLFVLFQAATPALSQSQQPPPCEVRRMGTNVNTPLADMAPLRYADKLYFTSMVADKATGKKVSRTFSALRNEPPFQLPENPRGANEHMANISLTLKADRMYYSMFKEGAAGKREGTKLWYRDRSYDGSWGPPVRLPRNVNLPDWSATQPAVGYDKKLGRQVLYFVSDRPGGKGGLDIWCSVLEPDHVKGEISFGEPFNLPFNTAKDEVSPFFHALSQTLFFSSNGLRGYGGFDIYHTKKRNGGAWAVPQNFEEPLNSPNDDLYFSYHDGSNLAYFSSNRPAPEHCPASEPNCRGLDVFQSELRAQLRLYIVLAGSEKPLTGCNVELVDTDSGITETSLVALPTSQVVVNLVPGKNYQLIVSQRDHYPIFTPVKIGLSEIFDLSEKRILVKPMLPGAVKKTDDGN